jgi:hypothetical protein
MVIGVVTGIEHQHQHICAREVTDHRYRQEIEFEVPRL